MKVAIPMQDKSLRFGWNNLNRSQLTLHATRRTHNDASRLMSPVSPSLVRPKPGILRPGFVGTRGQWPHDYGMQDHHSTPSPVFVKLYIRSTNPFLICPKNSERQKRF